ncbi:MAG: acyl-CoA dehydrogenase family protein, partial [Candidatus Binatia bacterium]
MDFGLSEDQEMLRHGAREFLSRECPPARVREAFESSDGLCDPLDRQMATMGWNGILVPESCGGLGLAALDAAVILIELGAAAVPGPFLFSAVLATSLLRAAGTARQKKAWLPRLARGEATAALAWLEESDRLDPEGVGARARRRGSRYLLTGTKLFVPYARTADLLVAPFRTGAGGDGVTFFLIPLDAPGISTRPLDVIDRTRRFFEVDFRSTEIPVENVLGDVGGGARLLERLVDLGAVALAADGLGGSEKVLEMAVAYAKTREQFGKPIASFQAMKHMAAEMVAEIEPARSLVWYAAHALDARPREASRAASMAKARLSDVYARSAGRSVQMHGGIGFTWEH